MGKLKDKTGQRFGRLLVLKYEGRLTTDNGNVYSAYLCQCDCGTIVVKDGANLGRGILSCGCYRREKMSTRVVVNKTHGLGNSSEYKAWWKLIKNHPNDVPSAWLTELVDFIADVGQRPSAKHYLTRRDATLPFSKTNTYWRTSELRQLPDDFDLTGMRFGKLIVKNIAEYNTPRSTGDKYWACRCDCGNVTTVSRNNLFAAKVLSCGCLAPQLTSVVHTTHGVSAAYPTEYNIWFRFVNSCTNPKNSAYRYYGGRGITVCERWLKNPRHFLEDMGPRPSRQMRLERIDKNQGFNKINCHWVPCTLRKKRISDNATDITTVTS